MKTVKHFFIMALMVILFEGCKKDDPTPNQAALLVDSWEAVSFVSSNCTDPSKNGNTTCTNSCEILVFTTTSVSFDGDTYPYTTSGNSLTIALGGGETSTYSISGTTLTLTSQDIPADGGCKNVNTFKKYDYKVTDIDGNIYNTVIIGTQEWMKENLKTTHYRDGSAIPNVTQTSDWLNLSIGAYCDYNNIPSNAATYGRLYNRYTVADPRNVCPSGWHVPSLDEGNILVNKLGGEDIAGGKMKSTGILQNGDGLWYSPNAGATNASGFNGIPGGTRYDAGDFRGFNGYMDWRTGDGWTLILWDVNTKVDKMFNYPTNGTSIRCVKD